MIRRTFVAENEVEVAAIEQVLTMIRELQHLADATPGGRGPDQSGPPDRQRSWIFQPFASQSGIRRLRLLGRLTGIFLGRDLVLDGLGTPRRLGLPAK
jgi:hypothetical protein